MGASAISAVGQIYGAQVQSEAIRAKADFDAAQAEINAKFAEMEAKEVINAGDRQAREYRKKVRQTAGAQRAALAASGVDVDVGTAAQLQRETAETGALDVMAIKNNAWRQAFGLTQESIAQRYQAQFTRVTGEQAARATLISGYIGAAGSLAGGAERLAFAKAGG